MHLAFGYEDACYQLSIHSASFKELASGILWESSSDKNCIRLPIHTVTYSRAFSSSGRASVSSVPRKRIH